MSSVNPIVTYVRDPDLVPPITPVILVSGSIALNLSPGDISVGAVELKDEDSDRRVHVDLYDDAVTAATNVLRVQSIDQAGEVVAKADIENIDAGVDVLIAGQAQTQATITAILNAQGTQSTSGLATSSNQALGNITLNAIDNTVKDGNQKLTAILNGQGTQATSASQAVQIATAGASNALLTAIHESQGTQAQWAKQDVQIATAGATNATLTAILNGQGTLAQNSTVATSNAYLAQLSSQVGRIESQGTIPGVVTLFSNKTTPGASANADVSAYIHHTVQHVISGSIVVQVRTSLDGVSWHVEDETNQSDLFNLYGKVKFISSNVVYANGTVSTLLMSGN